MESANKVVKNSNKGAKPGERRGGRRKGVPNKATAAIRDIAREYTTQAIATLVEVMGDNTQPAPARVSAANALLDRGYGKPSNVIAGDEDGGPLKVIHEIALTGPSES